MQITYAIGRYVMQSQLSRIVCKLCERCVCVYVCLNIMFPECECVCVCVYHLAAIAKHQHNQHLECE